MISIYSAQTRNKFHYLNCRKSLYLRYPFFYDMALSYRANGSRCFETGYWSPLTGPKCSRGRQNRTAPFLFFNIPELTSNENNHKNENSSLLRHHADRMANSYCPFKVSQGFHDVGSRVKFLTYY